MTGGNIKITASKRVPNATRDARRNCRHSDYWADPRWEEVNRLRHVQESLATKLIREMREDHGIRAGGR